MSTSAFPEFQHHLNEHYHNVAVLLALGMCSNPSLILGCVLTFAALPCDRDQCLPAEGIPNYKE